LLCTIITNTSIHHNIIPPSPSQLTGN